MLTRHRQPINFVFNIAKFSSQCMNEKSFRGYFGGGTTYNGSAPLCDAQLDEESGIYPLSLPTKKKERKYDERPCMRTVEEQVEYILNGC